MSAGHKVEILAEITSEPERFAPSFHHFLEIAETKDSSWCQAAAKNLLNLYHGTWREPEDAPILEEEFARRIKLEAISFDEDESEVEVYYGDADLFAGHQIKVVVSYDGAVKTANLH